ncbi:MAG: hypothetical protein Q9219_003179 [cf. Caloplaca sp. 3 TL-2023]
MSSSPELEPFDGEGGPDLSRLEENDIDCPDTEDEDTRYEKLVAAAGEYRSAAPHSDTTNSNYAEKTSLDEAQNADAEENAVGKHTVVTTSLAALIWTAENRSHDEEVEHADAEDDENHQRGDSPSAEEPNTVNPPRSPSYPPTEVDPEVERIWAESQLTISQHDDPDPSIWCKLPQELVTIVAEHSDFKTLVSWSCTDRYFLDIASDLLWRTFTLWTEDLQTTYNYRDLGLDLRGPIEIYGYRVLFLANKCLRRLGFPKMPSGLPYKLPAQRIKRLEIKFYEFSRKETRTILVQDHGQVGQVVAKSLKLMTQLQHLSFQGPLNQGTFEHILFRNHLCELVLRKDRLLLHANELGPSPFSQVLDFRRLTALPHLRLLDIWFLFPREAQGLAQAVVNLNLQVLRLETARPHGDRGPEIVGTWDNESPISMFLSWVCLLRPCGKSNSSSSVGGLPQTLQTLYLNDLDRTVKSKNDRLIIDAVGGCTELQDLVLYTNGSRQLNTFFHEARLPALKMLGISGCRHILEDNQWRKLDLDPEHRESRDLVPRNTMRSFARFLFRHRSHLANVEMILAKIIPPGVYEYTYSDAKLWFTATHLDRLWDLHESVTSDRRRQDSWTEHNWYTDTWLDGCGIGSFCYADEEVVADL